ncbi:MAG TPA: VOC family protein [Bacteroidales bacterium]|jgi:hypothetical protein|nr:VOC family protein [Bacteroidales bacterium]
MKPVIPFFLILCAFSFEICSQEIPEYSKRVDQVLWVVDDLDNIIAQWAILGFTQVMDLGTVDAHLKRAGKVVALKLAKANLGGAHITWIQPSGEASVFSEFRNSYGNGAMSLVHRLDNKEALLGELDRLSRLGIEIKEEITIKTRRGDLHFVLLDTQKEGKYYLGLTVGDEDVKMMQELSPVNRNQMKINQYAFAIRQPEPVSAFWHKVGQPEFQINHPDLGNKHYYGRSVDHDLIQGWQRHGSVAYEWCIPVKLPIVYDDHIRKHGEGIHHLAFTVDDMDKVLADYTSRGFVVSMGGTWGKEGEAGSGRYEYIDLEQAGGLTMELLWSHP